MQWYIRQDPGYRGPLDESSLLREYDRGYVDADTLVSPDPTTWLPFADYPRLQTLVEQRGHASIRPKPLSVRGAQADGPASRNAPAATRPSPAISSAAFHGPAISSTAISSAAISRAAISRGASEAPEIDLPPIEESGPVEAVKAEL